MIKRIITSLSPVPVFVVAYWLFGGNFDERNFATGYVFLMAVFFSVWIYFFPGWDK